MNIIELEQNSESWLEFRKNKIGASDAPIIMYESPWTTPYQLWERKLGLAPEQEKTQAMIEGHVLENSARIMVQSTLCMKLPPVVCQHQERNWQIASLDGLNLEEKVAVEIKCPGEQDHELAGQGIVPEKYRYQLQHQLAVTGFEKMYYFSFDKRTYSYFGGAQGYLVEVKRDQDMIDRMTEKELAFYRCMTDFIEPELCDRDYAINNSEEWQGLAFQWITLKRQKEHFENLEQETREKLIAMCSSNRCRGAGLKAQKVMQKGSVDYSKIPELAGIDLDQYRKPNKTLWRFTFDKE